MKEREEVLSLLQHTRHDWLNRIQLIKGYLALGKVDQAERVIEEIVLESQQESKLTQLGLPEFASLLILHNWGWEGHTFQIEYECMNDSRASFVDDAVLTKWMRSFFEKITQSLHPLYGNQLYIAIESSERELNLHVEFEGKLQKIEILKQWLSKEHEHGKGIHVHLTEINESTFISNVKFEGME